MIHHIIFDNVRDGAGYAIYGCSEQFPKQYERPIEKICDRYLLGEITGNTAAIRYAPLEDRYLLSVIFRFPFGSAVQERGHLAVVNFLLEAPDADALFRNGFEQKKVIRMAAEKYCGDIGISPDGMPALAEGPKDHGVETLLDSDELLLEGALCGAGTTLFNQLFLSQRTDPDKQIRRLTQLLPWALCRQLSFHTNIHSEADSHGIALCFYPPQLMQSARGWKEGGPSGTNKAYILEGGRTRKGPPQAKADREKNAALFDMIQDLEDSLYPFLREAVTDWKTLLKLASQYRKKGSLRPLTEYIPRERISQLLEQGDWDPKTWEAVQAVLPSGMRVAKRSDLPAVPAVQAGASREEPAEQVAAPREESAEKTAAAPGRPDGHRRLRWTASPLFDLAGILLSLAGLFYLIDRAVNFDILRDDRTIVFSISTGGVINVVQLVLIFGLGWISHFFLSSLCESLRRKKSRSTK